jgi:hypothetical protein
MNAYEITNVVPEVTDGVMVNLDFDLTVSDYMGNAESRHLQGSGGGVPVPSSDALQAMCFNIAKEQGTIQQLDTMLSDRRTPVYVPPPPPPPPSLDQVKATLMAQIDANIARVYSLYTRFQMEYEEREKAALEYKASDYTSDPTPWLTAFADTTGISYPACAELVLSQANALRDAIKSLGIQRMYKYKVYNAATAEDAQSAFGTVMADVAVIARSLP